MTAINKKFMFKILILLAISMIISIFFNAFSCYLFNAAVSNEVKQSQKQTLFNKITKSIDITAFYKGSKQNSSSRLYPYENDPNILVGIKKPKFQTKNNEQSQTLFFDVKRELEYIKLNRNASDSYLYNSQGKLIQIIYYDGNELFLTFTPDNVLKYRCYKGSCIKYPQDMLKIIRTTIINSIAANGIVFCILTILLAPLVLLIKYSKLDNN